MEFNEVKCPFCNIKIDDIVLKNEKCYARFDKYPVNKGHVLIIPFRHFDNYFEATYEEKIAILSLLDEAKKYLDKEFTPDGFNIGINVGQSAGQTIMHLHLHLIPRYTGDMDDPRGGVRGVLPEKRIY
jgi:diadenosine tetraphosphate (Ap4A) HIT family hydrolase